MSISSIRVHSTLRPPSLPEIKMILLKFLKTCLPWPIFNKSRKNEKLSFVQWTIFDGCWYFDDEKFYSLRDCNSRYFKLWIFDLTEFIYYICNRSNTSGCKEKRHIWFMVGKVLVFNFPKKSFWTWFLEYFYKKEPLKVIFIYFFEEYAG